MDNLYFIALLPPEDLQFSVNQFKEIAWEKFHSRQALKSPPHITLVPPQRWKASTAAMVKKKMQNWAGGQIPFSIQLQDFGAFVPRVVYIQVVSTPALETIHQECNQILKPYLEKIDPRPYHPHMTIAFKDLSQSAFYRAWDYFRQIPFTSSFRVDSITLLIHQEGRWKVEDNWLLRQ
ncbi:MAG: 2'-5' RNA ligase family protein [Saprospiraceae bacterium]|nr:2'-5' RNA ligase family protein [Saprospiraceae bacterium]